MALTIGELVGYLDLDDTGWSRKNKQAHNDMRSMRDDVDKLSEGTNKLAGDFLKLANNLSNIPTAMAAITGTATVLANLAGVVGVIPAAGAAAVTTIAALKIGMSGFGDALKASGDPAKFAESLKTLSPNARAAAIAVRDLTPAWTDLKKSVQDELFSGVGKTIKQVGGTYMPILKRGLTDVAAGFDDASSGVRKFFMQAQTQKDVNAIFGGTSGVVASLSSALGPALEILRDLVAVGMEFLPVGGGFGEAARHAADFVHQARETGQLKKWISDGFSTVGDLAKLFKNIGGIVTRVFGGLNAGGASMLQTMIKVTDQVKAFLDSAKGQDALHALGSALNAVSTVVTQVLITALQTLAPLVVELAPPFADLARQVGSTLVAALHVAAPLLHVLAGFIAENIDWLGPLAIAIYVGVQAFQAVITVVRFLNILAATNPWLILIAATIALAVLIITHWDQIKAAIAAAWDWIKTTARTAWDHIKSAIVDPIVDAGRSVGTVISNVVQFFVDLPGKIAQALRFLADVITKPFRDAYNTVSGIVDDILSAIDKITGNFNGKLAGGFKFGGSYGTPELLAAAHGRAGGGRTTPGNPYWVGEQGRRELFWPDQAGSIFTEEQLARYGGSGDRSLVSIGTFNATPTQSPHAIASDLDWLSRGGGY